MLGYDWGNPSTIMLADDETAQDSDQTRRIFENYHHSVSENGHHQHFLSQNTTVNNNFSHQQHQNYSFYDEQCAYNTTTFQNPVPPMLTLDPINGVGGYSNSLVPKNEEIVLPENFTARIGLNLGHRTYFSSDDDFVNRLYRRSRSGPLDSVAINMPRCQAEGCTADLTNAKHYHRRHKVCEFHSKASTTIAGGLTQRFCQQCSRFHLLSEFDNGKRSCRKRLADHNRRRRKNQTQIPHQIKSSQPEIANNKSSRENLTRSSLDSGTHPLSSLTVAASPIRMSLDCFRSQNGVTRSSSSSSMLFYCNE